MPLRAALFDLDGVIRQYGPEHPAAVEAAAGLAAGTLARIAFAPDRLAPAVDGRHTFEQWRDAIGAALERDHGVPDGCAVTDRFLAFEAGTVDHEALGLVRRVRRSGHPVGLLTNATSRLADELEALGLRGEFDVVCNSSELGVSKPAARAFELAAERLGVAPDQCFFTDDRAENVEAAAAVGFAAHHFTAAGGLADALAAAGLLG